ncbi:MAG: hypothetical protein R3Y43_03635 [Alphaproteobacteria bacterium]
MKIKLAIFVCLFSLISTAKAEIDNNKIYLFYSQRCGHCHTAMEDIQKSHPKLEIEMMDIANKKAYKEMLLCAKKHNLGNRIGTPLFCMGNNYLMGWSEENAKKFDILVKELNKQQ